MNNKQDLFERGNADEYEYNIQRSFFPPSKSSAEYETTILELSKEIADLQKKNDEMEELFNMQWEQVQAVQNQWREQHPKQPLIHPDLGGMLKWILTKVYNLETERDQLRKVLRMNPGNQNE